MKSWAEQYLDRLDALSGSEAIHYKVSASGVVPPISVATYLEEGDGHQFGFTIGLSAYDHPSWTVARPELCISIASADPYWVLAIGDVADKLKGQCPFCYGEIIKFGCPISKESEMSAFVVFAPTFISEDDRTIKLPGWTVNIAQMYPIYDGEIGLIDSRGLEYFFSRPGSFFEAPDRQDLSKL